MTVRPWITPWPTSYQCAPSIEICLSTVIAGAGVVGVSMKFCRSELKVTLPVCPAAIPACTVIDTERF